MPKLRAIIVDDEAPARLRLRELIERDARVSIIGECASGADAVVAVNRTRPDLLFLDVQMPVLDGFQVLAELGPESTPVTIFVTAYDRYALAAFEAHALDYLLKPYSDERFERALARALAHIEMQRRDELASRVLAMLERRPADPTRLAVKSGDRVILLKTEEIDWVEAAGVYVELHVGKKVYLHRMALTDLEAQLDPARFIRIHRSTLVNLDRVRELAPCTHGELYVLLMDGTRLKLSRSYRARFEERLGQSI
ncbi:LytTR family DNA-binding domain-containing protein [uncultured Paludibaculum sp.]|uniref:LytR/AlgR family response regulator transcription factor n=1 Tax=uncultured Paludibaculum sp. TaxID=1765020 RepID=UPI002AAAFC9D|nr:LytTR family DNA-binding domain-containing protein [uncultured Paludibaculum sp.]